MNIPASFSQILKEAGISLSSEGVGDIALTPKAAARAIQALKDAGVGITGGEAWQRKADRFLPTYDNWSIESSDFSNRDDYLRESWKRAECHITRYASGSRDDILIAIGI